MKYSDITADGGMMGVDFTEVAQAVKELLRLLRGWREKLGINYGLLDQYIAALLNAMFDTANASDTGEAGFDNALSDLRGLLRYIKEGKEAEAQKHSFYPQVRAYMNAHPFPKDFLYYETYCVGLFPQYLPFAVKNFMDDCDDKFQTALKEYKIPKLRKTLLSSGAGITEEGLDELHYFISWIFTLTTPSSVFMQGMVDQLLLSLLERDKESGRYVFQRLIDGEIGV